MGDARAVAAIRSRPLWPIVLLGACLVGVFASARGVPTAVSQSTIALSPVLTGLTEPLFVTTAGDGTNRLFVVQRGGIIRVAVGGVLQSTPFLDVSGIITTANGEQGLLGLAFDPNYATNRRFYVYYTASNGDNTAARYLVSSTDPNRADPATGTVLFAIPDRFGNHNGGMMLFGPDGNLYIGTGDGGSAGDPDNNAQNLNSLLGKLLRISVSTAQTYTVPSTNPFVGQPGARGEVYALGLRNPWRFSFDRTTGDLFIADVGQSNWEEIDLHPAGTAAGENYQWSCSEGNHPFNTARVCTQGRSTAPIFEYNHSQGDCSITGGYMYRGTRVPALAGAYVYGDYCTGRIWALRRGPGNTWTSSLLMDTNLLISSFGQDDGGELLVVDIGGGAIHRITDPAAPTATRTATATTGPTATATQTPNSSSTPTPVRTATPTATPSSSTTTVTFDDVPGEDQPLNGQYPSGLIDWGTSQWYHSAPWQALTTKSVGFNGPGITSAGFNLVGSSVLTQLDAYNGGPSTSTLSLACSGQPTVQRTLTSGQIATVLTGWNGTCGTVTVASTNGWDTNLDNLVLAPPVPDLVITSLTANATTADQPATISATVQNQGPVGTGVDFHVHVFDGQGGPMVAHLVFTALAGGASQTVGGTIPGGTLSPGAHSFLGLADGHDVVAESNENNNTRTTSVTVAAAPTATATAGVPSATATRTPTQSPSSTPTPTTPPVPGQSVTTVTFDDIPGQNQPLSGQYPSGVIDWGTNQWYHSAPWRGFPTKSVGFTSTRMSSTLTFLSPRRLVRVDAFNGSSSQATVTFTCAGQPTKQVTLAPNVVTAIDTGWTGVCGSVTIATSNGWNTNFDNFAIAAGPGTRITFDDRPGQNQPLNGQYPAGVIDWGTNQWYHSATWRGFATKSIGFTSTRMSSTWTFVSPRRLMALDAFNGGGASATVTLTCPGQPTKQVTLGAAQLATIDTGWTGTCGSVTIATSNGWDTNFDNLLLD